MGIDHSTGSSYGIAIELDEDNVELIIDTLSDAIEGVQPDEDYHLGIFIEENWAELTEYGLNLSIEGDSMSGPEYLIISLIETVHNFDEYETGVRALSNYPMRSDIIDTVHEFLYEADIKHQGPAWIIHKSIH